MHIERGNIIRAARRCGPVLAVGVIVAASMLVSSGCQSTVEPTQRPVVIGLPAQVTQKVDNAQAAFINAVGTLATSYDEAVCEEEDQMAGLSQERQAVAEANLQIAQAAVTARSQAIGGGPEDGEAGETGEAGKTGEAVDADQGIIVFEEAPPEPRRDRGGWMCMRASGEPGCVSAAASGVAKEVYRDYIEGYDLNPVTTGDVLEAFAADAKWADQYLVGAADRADAFGQIRQACQDGDSPLARFFEAAVNFDNPDVRRDLTILRDDFVSMQQDVCEKLPIYYANLMDELQHNLSMRVRNNRCTIPEWHPIWDR